MTQTHSILSRPRTHQHHHHGHLSSPENHHRSGRAQVTAGPPTLPAGQGVRQRANRRPDHLPDGAPAQRLRSGGFTEGPQTTADRCQIRCHRGLRIDERPSAAAAAAVQPGQLGRSLRGQFEAFWTRKNSRGGRLNNVTCYFFIY